MPDIIEEIVARFKVIGEKTFDEIVRDEFSSFALEPVHNNSDSYSADKNLQLCTAKENNEILSQNIKQLHKQFSETQRSLIQTEDVVQKRELELHTLREKLSERKFELNEKRNEALQQFSKFRRFLGPYKEGLALDLDMLENDVYEIILRGTSNAIKDRTLTIRIKQNDDLSHEVVSCEPALPGLGNLTAELKETNSIRRFLTQVHRLL